jgi:5-methylcytosine-specific restriction endonuclease McrA
MCCGASPEDGKTTIQVDHILPVSEYWHRRLDPTNLQVLCEACNKGKGAWDHTDWRPKHI